MAFARSNAQLYFDWLSRLPTATPLAAHESHPGLAGTYHRCAQYLLTKALLSPAERDIIKSVEARYARDLQ